MTELEIATAPVDGMQPSIEDKKDQGAAEFVEDPAHHDDQGLLKSRFDELSITRTVWMFRWSALYAIMAYSMSTIDSWQVTIAGSIIVEPGFLKQFGTLSDGSGVYSLDTRWVSAWGAVINVGQIVCMLWVPYVADRYGRKMTFYCCGVAYVVCLFCLTFAKTPGVWLVGKLFVGIAVGTQQLTVTPYAIELAPSAIRGGIAVFQSIWGGVCGIICSAMLQICATRYPDNYKLPIWVLWGLAGLMLFCIVVIPETPWFYARRGDRENGMKVLKRLYSTVPGYNYEEEWGIMIRTVEHEASAQAEEKTVTYKEVFRGTNLFRTLVVCVVFQSTIWNGTPLIGTYSTYFFAIAGESNPFTASLIVNAVALATMIIYTFVTDKLGRRYPMCGAETLCNVLMFIIGGLYYAPTNASKGKVLIFLCCVFTAAFNILCNVYWLTAAEIPTVRTRIKTATTSLFLNAMSGIVTCFAIPPLLVKLNIRAGFVFGATAFPLTLAMWYLLPETKGRAIAEIDELFEKRVPAWRWSSTVTEVEEHMRAAVANDKIARAEV